MELDQIFSLISRWFHILPATLLVGGTLFLRFGLVGPLAEQGASDNLCEAIRQRWARLVMISILFLLVSGLYNSAIKAMSYDLSMTYNILLGVKILLGLAIFYLVSVLSGRSDRAKRFRQRYEHWLNVTLILMVVLVGIAGWMKTQQFPPKTPAANPEVQQVRTPTEMNV